MVNKKDEIMRATYIIFAKEGYHASMSDIANSVGIKVPSIYNHFKSKEEIIYATIQKEVEEFFVTLFKEIDARVQEGCKDKLRHIFDFIITYFNDIQVNRFWKNISLIYQEDLRATCTKSIQIKEIAFSYRISEIIEKGFEEKEIKGDDVESIVFLYLAMIQGILFTNLLYHESELELDVFREKTWYAFWSGIEGDKGNSVEERSIL